MDVQTGLKFTVSLLLMGAAGCMNPGYQTLHPPGFSSTALRNKLHRQELIDSEMSQLTGEFITSSAPLPASESRKKSRERASHSRDWPKLAGPQNDQSIGNGGSEELKPRTDIRFSGWPDTRNGPRFQ